MIHDDNAELAYLLNHNRIGVTIDALDTLVEIHPNEEYWTAKLGLVPFNLNEFNKLSEDIYAKMHDSPISKEMRGLRKLV